MGLEFVTRSNWGSQYASVYEHRMNDSYYRLNLPLDYLFCHISVTPEVGDSLGDESEAMRIIERVGYDRFNSGFSYNTAVHDTGRIMLGMPFTAKGTHTINDKSVPGFPFDLNRYGHAVCLPQVESTLVTDIQVQNIARWGAALKLAGINNARNGKFYPHATFAWKACPGAKMIARLDDCNDLLNDYIRNGIGDEMDISKEDMKKIVANAAYDATVKALDENRYRDRDNKEATRSVSGLLLGIDDQLSKS